MSVSLKLRGGGIGTVNCSPELGWKENKPYNLNIKQLESGS
jgi:hypothetical protein